MPTSSRRLLQYNQVLELFPLQLRNQIFSSAEYRDVRANTYVFKRGEEGDFMAGVMSGRLRMCVESSFGGKEMLVTMVERGEMVGEMSVLDGQPRAVDVVAESACTLMIIKRDDFMPILRSSPDAMLGLLRMTCHRMRLYLQTMESIALQSLPVRMAHYLLHLYYDYGREQDGKHIISAQLSQIDIAHQIACSRESVNKQMSAFAEKGLLALDGDNIIILDIEGLKKAVAPQD